jgi:hypothetical protein
MSVFYLKSEWKHVDVRLEDTMDYYATLMNFLSPYFSFSFCDTRSVVISKVHYKPIIFLEFIQSFNDDYH